MPATEFVSGLAAFADRYDGLILDQWGVLHNGSRPYPGVMEVLAELRRQGKRLALLTNSGRRAQYNKARLADMGFDLGLFEGVVTSGEAAWLGLSHRDEPRVAGLGQRCMLITRGGDHEVVEGLGLELVESAASADFVFLTGVDSPPLTLADYEPIIRPAVERGLPMICSNPDLVAVTGHGLATAPGTVANRYAELGGEVIYFGKPNKPIYRACLRLLDGIEPARICCVGDSLEHDIAGAVGMGLDSCFITSGIHGEAFVDAPDRAAALAPLVAKYGATPKYATRYLAW